MHRTVVADLAAAPDAVAGALADLGTYPSWLGLVAEAEPADPADGDPGPAWWVTLRAAVGPFARSKKLRMVRTAPSSAAPEATDPIRFERRETDGRSHAAWTLAATVAPLAGGGSSVSVDLAYDGGLWTSALEPILGHFVDDAGPSLDAHLAGH